MQANSTTSGSRRVDPPSRGRFSNAFGRLLKRANRPAPVLDTLADVALIRIASGTLVMRQKRAIIRLLRGIPANRNHVILDVAAAADDDMGLPVLISGVLAEARRCRLNIVLGQVSARQELLLELTRIVQIVPCFHHNSDAIRACMNGQFTPASQKPVVQSAS